MILCLRANCITFERIKCLGTILTLPIVPNAAFLILVKSFLVCLGMDGSGISLTKEMKVSLDSAAEEEYASQSKLLQEFINISTIDKAWTFKCNNGMVLMFFCFTVFFHINTLFLLFLETKRSFTHDHVSAYKNCCRFRLPGYVLI